MRQNKTHNTVTKRIGIAKDSNGLLRSNDFWFIDSRQDRCTKRKREDRTMNTQNILCQQAVDFILKEPFSRCLQSFPSICQTLLLHKLAKFDCKRNSLFSCLGSNLYSPRLPFPFFNPGTPFCSQAALFGFSTWPLLFFSSFFVV